MDRMRIRIVAVAALVLVGTAAFADVSPSRLESPSPGCEAATALAKELEAARRTVSALRAQTDRLKARLAAVSDEECRGALFRVYWEFYGDVQRALTIEAQRDGDPAGRARLERSLKLVGWRLVGSEAGDYVAEERDWLPRVLGPSLPPMWRDFITLRIGDAVRGGLTEDAGLKIGWDTLRARIERWDEFLATYPRFIWRDGVAEDNKTALRILLRGVDNSPVFDSDGVLLPEVRKELEAYAANPRAARRAVVKRYLALLKKGGWKESDEAAAYLDKQGLATMAGIEPPHE